MGLLEDKDEIRELMRRYNQAIDFPDLETWLDCWADDGVMRFGDRPPVEGKDALREYGSGRQGGSFHLATSEIITVAGDNATVTSYIAVVAGPTDPRIRLAGRYDDRVRRVDGRWLFVERRLDPKLRYEAPAG